MKFFKEHKFDFIFNICFIVFLFLNWFAGDIVKKIISFLISFIGAIIIVAILAYTLHNLTKSKTFNKIFEKLNISYITRVTVFFSIAIAIYTCLNVFI